MMGLQRKLLSSLLALQWIGSLVVFALIAIWLQIPDSHVWQFAISILTGAVIVIAFCWLQVAVFAKVNRGATRGQLWARMAGFAIVAAIWFLSERWISSGSNHLWLHAAYWNSRLSPGQRVIFTPARLVSWSTALITLLEWIMFGILLPLAIEASTTGPLRISIRRVRLPWSKALYWLAVIVACLVGMQLTGVLISWMPGKGISGQIASVAARLLFVYTADVLLWCILLMLAGSWMDNPSSVTKEAEAVR
jgi:hypothetical protein